MCGWRLWVWVCMWEGEPAPWGSGALPLLPSQASNYFTHGAGAFGCAALPVPVLRPCPWSRGQCWEDQGTLQPERDARGQGEGGGGDARGPARPWRE